MSGKVFQINISNGGVPKTGLPRAEFTQNGLTGDAQRALHVHGGPDRAVCLYSLEVIQALQSEGHPIFPGAAGENVTVSGLVWEVLMPGARLRLGPEVVIEITKYTTPCDNLVPYFSDGNFNRINQKTHPGWSRLYARVLVPGEVKVGDAVRVE